ncbi:MAG: gliding motility-associated ABC transporter substrate-binding protein GldG, partial [Flavobacterium sp.]|nr:gliding motility-associated ABC transporter substrate-binding protein GldG [Flavobacterium sp.]
GEFKKLQTETQQLLEEFKATNPNIVYQFVNPLENEKQRDSILQSLVNQGLTPVNVTLSDKGKQTQEVVFPWAIVTYGNKTRKVPLLKNKMGASTSDKVLSSVQHLEYAFANAFNSVSNEKSKKVAIIKGNGEMADVYMADFIKSVRDNYGIGPFTLDSVAKNPNETLKYLKKYDLIVIAKPTEAFTDAEKQVLDQYTINGGKSMWLLDNVNMEMDSLYNQKGSNLAFPRDLNLNDLFFKYGIRINPLLIKDLQCASIALATGKQGSETQYTEFPWLFSPLVYPIENKNKSQNNPIISNLDAVKFEFVNPIEGLKNNIDKTILLQTSTYSKVVGVPVQIGLQMVGDRPNPDDFKNNGNIPVAVLLEGKFKSVFENRVLPFVDSQYKSQNKLSKIIVVSDGDIIKNQLDKQGQPLELGFDKWTNKQYANKEFLINCVNYLLDDSGLITLRNKQVNLPVLDKQKVYNNYNVIGLTVIGVPLIVLALFGIVFTYFRKKKYSK